MKKITSFILALILLFSFASCANEEKQEKPNLEHLKTAPILGAEVESEENKGFYALTKNGMYSWQFENEKGEIENIEYDGVFCLYDVDICTFTREQTNGKITLKFTGNVESYNIYSAPKSEIENSRGDILKDEYKHETLSSVITFPESGEYYYVVRVNYTEGEVFYGFLLAE